VHARRVSVWLAAGFLSLLGSAVVDTSQADPTYVFPLRATQSDIRGMPTPWCFNSQAYCHHDYQAADIFISPGTTVRAIVDATIISKNNVASCDAHAGGDGYPRVQLRGADGQYYFYAHFAAGSLTRRDVGARVSRGDYLGEVGGSACAMGTSPHLHLQMHDSTIQGDAQSTNIQPRLTRLFDSLP
jgi:murein DD-endopeptidase MepM/ murein hydrolase activator NlpD